MTKSLNNLSRQWVRHRRGFTLAELIIAGVIAAFLLGTLAASVSQFARSRNSSRLQSTAFMRADTALEKVRRELAGLMRSDDLFDCRVLLFDDVDNSPVGELDRDELLVFNNSLEAVRNNDKYTGEGVEYEAQVRVIDDELGPCLWLRRDAVPDRYPRGGGVASPAGEGVIALSIEAYDGNLWYQEWDSDQLGMPWALRVRVTACGKPVGSDAYEAPTGWASLETVIAIDRIILPTEQDIEEEEGEGEDEGEGEGEQGQAGQGQDGTSEGGDGGGGPGGGGSGGSGGGSRGGSGGGGGGGSGGGSGLGTGPGN